MFARWMDGERLGFLAAFSEVETGRIVSLRLLGQEVNVPTKISFFSENHGRTINLQKFAAFVVKHISPGRPSFSHFINFKTLYERISGGFNLWDYSTDAAKEKRLLILKRYGFVWSNQQAAERANKAQNLAIYNQRQETNSSLRLMAQSCIMEVSEARVLGEKRDSFCGKGKIMQNYDQLKSVID